MPADRPPAKRDVPVWDRLSRYQRRLQRRHRRRLHQRCACAGVAVVVITRLDTPTTLATCVPMVLRV